MKADTVTANGSIRPKKYPIRCIECGKKAVAPAIIDRELQKSHDGRAYTLSINGLPVTKCDACGTVFFTEESDSHIDRALREQLALLTPDQIRTNIESLEVSQKELAEQIGVAPETLSRWLSGAMIQSRAMDTLLRLFFGLPEVREELRGAKRNPLFGQRVASRARRKGSHRETRYPHLEQRGEVERSQRLAADIRSRGSVFAIAS